MGEDLKNYSALACAYLGDAVYERHVREYILKSRGNTQVEKYHKIALRFVCAAAQAAAAEALKEGFDEEEVEQFRRGRNAKAHAAPKNAKTADYRKATGFETLIGWLWLQDRRERAEELMNRAVEYLEQQEA